MDKTEIDPDNAGKAANPYGTLMKQGAEAKVYSGTFLGQPCVVKERFPKKYRHPQLDKSLTQQRTKAEARCMMKCRINGIRTPAVYLVNLQTHQIYMEYLEGVTVRDYVTEMQKKHPTDFVEMLRTLALKIGSIIGIMHDRLIIHGDLTTSNMLLCNPPEKLDIALIDFGLSYVESLPEDRGVDLYVLERAFLSTHPNTEKLFDIIMEGYKTNAGKGAAEAIEKLEEVRMRGRKRTMVG